ncbi:hypothetical protein DFJ63DRAFT_311071 [Scheffersomyces coipomensis]|uniref:uncharacterized protein n=1 Tax=Scheffersomyces coipomensis TaxID=1788519 RepID=UPI00315CEACB
MKKSKSFSLKRFSLSSLRKSGKPETPPSVEDSPFPEFSKLDLAHTPRSSDSDTDFTRITTKKANNEKCAFCGEYLALNLPGEVIILLMCNDQCHQDCLTASLDVNNLDYLPICGQCKQPTRCLDEKTHSQIIQQLLLENTDEIQINEIQQIDVLEKSLSLSVDISAKDSYYDDLIEEILKPRVQCYSDIDKLKITKNSTHILDQVLTVRSPLVYNKQEPSPAEIKLKSRLIKYLKSHVLSKIINIEEEVVDIENLGELLLFDYMNLSTNAVDWDWMCCFLFEDVLILIIEDTLIGQVSITRDISGVNVFEQTGLITINLRNELLPELHLKSDNKLILMKWESILIDMNNKVQIENPNIIQFTTNAWGLLQGSDIELPKDLKHYSNLTIDGDDIPSSYLVQALPKAQPLPLNLVIAVPLFNRTTMSDEDLQSKIQITLHTIKDGLRPIDTLSLIFVGSYRNRNPKDKGTYIGFLDPTWRDWSLVLDDIEIIPRKSNMFKSEWDEMSLAFEKCLDLFALRNESEKNVTKMLVLNFNDYDPDVSSYDTSSLQKNLDLLTEKVSISFARIGSGYTDVIESISKLLAMNQNDQNHLKLNFSCAIIRYNSFETFIQGWSGTFSNMQSICIPTIAIDLAVTKEFEDSLSFAEVEVNGVLTKISAFKKATILVHDMLPLSERNIAFKIKLEVSSDMYQNLHFDDFKILTYNYSYLKHTSNNNAVSLSLSKSQLPYRLEQSTSTLHTLTNSSDNPTIQFLNIPLLPPLSSTREPALAQRQAELSVIEALNSTNAFNPKQCQDLLLNSISLMYAMISLTNDKGKINSTQLRNIFQATKGRSGYDIQNLEEEITHISHLFDEDATLAYTRCKDLIYFLT